MVTDSSPRSDVSGGNRPNWCPRARTTRGSRLQTVDPKTMDTNAKALDTQDVRYRVYRAQSSCGPRDANEAATVSELA